MFLSAEGMQISQERQLNSENLSFDASSNNGTTTPMAAVGAIAGLLSFAAMFVAGIALIRGLMDCGLSLQCPLEDTAIMLTVTTSVAIFGIVHAAMNGTAMQMLSRGSVATFFLGVFFTIAMT